MIDKAVIWILLNNPAVAQQLGTAVFAKHPPQDPPAKYATVRQISGGHLKALNVGRVGLAMPLVEVVVYAGSTGDADQAMDLIGKALDGYRGWAIAPGTVNIKGIFQQDDDEADWTQPHADDEQGKPFARMLFKVCHDE